jgi:hypothetical protein
MTALDFGTPPAKRRPLVWLAKALHTHPTPSHGQKQAGNYAKRVVRWRGLDIAIENEVGSERRGVDPTGKAWAVKVKSAYGYVKRSMGVDGDQVDVYLGPNLEAPDVYVVHQRKAGDWEAYDEDKCLIGWSSKEAATAAYLANYNDPRFLGPVTALPADEFVAKVKATKAGAAMIKAVLLFKSTIAPHMRHIGGKTVAVRGYSNRVVAHPDQLDMFAAPVKAEAKPVAATPEPAPRLDPHQMTRENFISAHRGRFVRIPGKRSIAGVQSADGASLYNLYPGDQSNGKLQRPVDTILGDIHRDQIKGHLSQVETAGLPNALPHEKRHADAFIPDHLLADYPQLLERQNRIKASRTPEPAKLPRKFYTTAVREPGTPHQRVGWLTGPHESEEEARSHLPRARQAAVKIDPRAHFDSFGTASYEAENHKPGVLNAHLGIG